MLYDCFDWFGLSQMLEFKKMNNKLQATVFITNNLLAVIRLSLLILSAFSSFPILC